MGIKLMKRIKSFLDLLSHRYFGAIFGMLGIILGTLGVFPGILDTFHGNIEITLDVAKKLKSEDYSHVFIKNVTSLIGENIPDEEALTSKLEKSLGKKPTENQIRLITEYSSPDTLWRRILSLWWLFALLFFALAAIAFILSSKNDFRNRHELLEKAKKDLDECQGLNATLRKELDEAARNVECLQTFEHKHCRLKENLSYCDIVDVHKNLDGTEWSISGIRTSVEKKYIKVFDLFGMFANKWIGAKNDRHEFETFLHRLEERMGNFLVRFLLTDPTRENVIKQFDDHGKYNIGVFTQYIENLRFAQQLCRNHPHFQTRIVKTVPAFRYRMINDTILVSDYNLALEKGDDGPHIQLELVSNKTQAGQPCLWEAFNGFFERYWNMESTEDLDAFFARIEKAAKPCS